MPRWENVKGDPEKEDAYRTYNREKQRKYRSSDPDKAREQHRRDHERLMADPVRLEKKRANARAKQRRYRAKNARKVQSQKLKSAYGITLEDYEALLAEQEEVCAICKQPETATRRGKVLKLAVDHCAQSGEVRGLLCMNCNQGIGKFKHDASLLVAAVSYLGAAL